MARQKGLIREQKGKAVSVGSDPPVGSVVPPSNSERLHHEALTDTAGLTLSQRLLVDDDERIFWGERDGDSRESESRDSEDNSADTRTDGPDFYPTRYSHDGFFKKLPVIPPELQHSPNVEGQEWGKVEETESTPGSVQKLLRDCGARGVTFLIPTYEERSWSPPVGYQCVYESYFQPGTRLWFPIPRLITSYVFQRDVALSQFVNGSYRIAELTCLKLQPQGNFSVKMRPNYNILTGHPNKTQGWNCCYFFIKSYKAAFYDPPREDFRVFWNFRIVDHPKALDYPDGFFDNTRVVAALSHQHWPDISEERIRKALARISRDYWTANLPCSVDSGKKHLQLFSKKEQAYLKRSKNMKEVPDLKVLLDGELDLVGSNPISILNGMDLGGTDLGESGSGGFLPDPLVGVHTDPIVEDKPLEIETTRPKRQSKKRSRNEGGAPDTGKDSATESPGDVYTEECPKKKKKKKKSAEKTQGDSVSGEDPITPSEGCMNRAVVPYRDISSDEPLLRKKRKNPAEERRGEKIPEGDTGRQVVLFDGEEGDACAGGESARRVSQKGSRGGDPPIPPEPRGIQLRGGLPASSRI
ncbi:hypothetical protein N665_0032s0024 [Sinapis alba]|nr:hypothetical protein N665_0032s0024 [Sinapis alba]